MQNQYEAEIDGLAYGGMGVARIDGKVCFVEGALPGERVRFVRMSEKKRFVVGRATEILVPSSHRVKPVCPYYGVCGGCQYQHLSYEKEVYYKAEQVKELLIRIGGFRDFRFEGVAPSPLQYGYRSSITLHRSGAGFGYFTNDNKTVIAISRCPIAAEAINRAIGPLDASAGNEDVTLKCDVAGNVWISGHPGHEFFKDDFLGTSLTFSPLAFSQVNREVAIAMAGKLRALMAQEARGALFDLYCGVGFFGLLMRGLFESVVGIDESRAAVECADAAKMDLGAGNAAFYCGEADDSFPSYYRKLRGEVNTLIIDPPRSGISKKLAAWLAGTNDAGTLYYVSCDPATLARDARLITQGRAWSLDSVGSFDMFPRTKHVESIALFKRCIR